MRTRFDDDAWWDRKWVLFGAGLMTVAFLVASGRVTGAEEAGREESGRRVAEEPSAFERIKALAGAWVRADEDGSPTDEVVSVFRVTAGGHTVIETLFPGSEMEMITMYSESAGRLWLTHYCCVGNQPRMRAEPMAGSDTLSFEFVEDPANGMVSRADRHMDEARFRFKSDDRIHTRWIMRENGEPVYTAEFDLVRRSKPVR